MFLIICFQNLISLHVFFKALHLWVIYHFRCFTVFFDEEIFVPALMLRGLVNWAQNYYNRCILPSPKQLQLCIPKFYKLPVGIVIVVPICYCCFCVFIDVTVDYEYLTFTDEASRVCRPTAHLGKLFGSNFQICAIL